ncbi:hypothetical protein LOAG_03206 [Loa loa]|uniref:Uncharacterized protein n=1 Tax=Loa loa TaxID=7209 RepID=A0A1S0U4X7_LOALO|nr:hypothetical protein LOAG_03206 [Loa loa]EFO25279.1 hypothetical protein LOAG_03206 [Loa loa]
MTTKSETGNQISQIIGIKKVGQTVISKELIPQEKNVQKPSRASLRGQMSNSNNRTSPHQEIKFFIVFGALHIPDSVSLAPIINMKQKMNLEILLQNKEEHSSLPTFSFKKFTFFPHHKQILKSKLFGKTRVSYLNRRNDH